MKQNEKVCGVCEYYGEKKQMCQKDPVFVSHSVFEWCGEGWWRKMSDITGKVEDYYFDDELTYAEQRVIDKKDKTYIVVSYPHMFPIEETYTVCCEMFDDRNHADLYISGLAEDRTVKIFEAYYDSNGSYWKTTEVEK